MVKETQSKIDWQKGLITMKRQIQDQFKTEVARMTINSKTEEIPNYCKPYQKVFEKQCYEQELNEGMKSDTTSEVPD